jgi:hypothetical protein
LSSSGLAQADSREAIEAAADARCSDGEAFAQRPQTAVK